MQEARIGLGLSWLCDPGTVTHSSGLWFPHLENGHLNNTHSLLQSQSPIMETMINAMYSSANKLKGFQYKSTTSVHSCYQSIANKADELLATAVGLVSNFHS